MASAEKARELLFCRAMWLPYVEKIFKLFHTVHKNRRLKALFRPGVLTLSLPSTQGGLFLHTNAPRQEHYTLGLWSANPGPQGGVVYSLEKVNAHPFFGNLVQAVYAINIQNAGGPQQEGDPDRRLYHGRDKAKKELFIGVVEKTRAGLRPLHAGAIAFGFGRGSYYLGSVPSAVDLLMDTTLAPGRATLSTYPTHRLRIHSVRREGPTPRFTATFSLIGFKHAEGHARIEPRGATIRNLTGRAEVRVLGNAACCSRVYRGGRGTTLNITFTLPVLPRGRFALAVSFQREARIATRPNEPIKLEEHVHEAIWWVDG